MTSQYCSFVFGSELIALRHASYILYVLIELVQRSLLSRPTLVANGSAKQTYPRGKIKTEFCTLSDRRRGRVKELVGSVQTRVHLEPAVMRPATVMYIVAVIPPFVTAFLSILSSSPPL